MVDIAIPGGKRGNTEKLAYERLQILKFFVSTSTVNTLFAFPISYASIRETKMFYRTFNSKNQ